SLHGVCHLSKGGVVHTGSRFVVLQGGGEGVKQLYEVLQRSRKATDQIFFFLFIYKKPPTNIIIIYQENNVSSSFYLRGLAYLQLWWSFSKLFLSFLVEYRCCCCCCYSCW